MNDGFGLDRNMGYIWSCFSNDANEPALGWGGSYQQDDDVDGGKGVRNS